MYTSKHRFFALLAAALVTVTALVGMSFTPVAAADDTVTYTASASGWVGDKCGGDGYQPEWDSATSSFKNLGRGSGVKIPNVDFGTGKDYVELQLSAASSSNTRMAFMFVDSYATKPVAYFQLSNTNSQFVWVGQMTSDLSGITGKHTVYIVGASGNKAIAFNLKSVRLSATGTANNNTYYTADTTDWSLSSGAGSVGTNTRSWAFGSITKANTVIKVSNINFTDVAKLSVFVATKGANTITVYDANPSSASAKVLGTYAFEATNVYDSYVWGQEVDISSLGLSGTKTIYIKVAAVNCGVMAIRTTRVVQDAVASAKGTYMASTVGWRVVPETEHGYDDRGEGAWSSSESAYTGVGRMTMLEIGGVDFGTGYNFVELMLNVPETCHERVMHVFVDSYKSGKPAARILMTKTSDKYTWQGQFVGNLSGLTGKHTVYIVSCTDQKGEEYHVSVKGIRLSNKSASSSGEVIYESNPDTWTVIKGTILGAYLTDPNQCAIGKNNNVIVRIDDVDWDNVKGVSFLVAAKDDTSAKMVSIYDTNPVEDLSALPIMDDLEFDVTTYAWYKWSDYVDASESGLKTGDSIWVMSLGANFNIMAMRTTTEDVSDDNKDSSSSSSSTTSSTTKKSTTKKTTTKKNTTTKTTTVNNGGYTDNTDNSYDDGYYDDGYTDDGYYDDGYTDDGYYDDGYTDDGYTDDGYTDDGYVDDGFGDYFEDNDGYNDGNTDLGDNDGSAPVDGDVDDGAQKGGFPVGWIIVIVVVVLAAGAVAFVFFYKKRAAAATPAVETETPSEE